MAREGKKQSSQSSIRDVARLAQVSLGSVSRVLNGAHDVTPEVRQKVEQAILRLGYRPNHVARSLRSRTSKTIGIMFNDLANPLYVRVFQAIEGRLGATGYMPLLANSLSVAEREVELLGVFRARAMDGVIITLDNERDPRVTAALRESPMPTVIYDRDLEVECDRLLVEHESALCNLVSRLIGLGHRRIALILPKVDVRPIRGRVAGFRAGFAVHRLEVPEDLIPLLPSIRSSAFDVVDAMLGGSRPPTAIVSHGSSVLGDVLNAIAARGLRIPLDVSVVSLGDNFFVRSHRPKISMLRVDPELVADRLVNLLLERIHDPGAPPGQAVVTPEFIDGESCGPAPASAREHQKS